MAAGNSAERAAEERRKGVLKAQFYYDSFKRRYQCIKTHFENTPQKENPLNYKWTKFAEPCEIAVIDLHDRPFPQTPDDLNKTLLSLVGDHRLDIEQDFFKGLKQRVSGVQKVLEQYGLADIYKVDEYKMDG